MTQKMINIKIVIITKTNKIRVYNKVKKNRKLWQNMK